MTNRRYHINSRGEPGVCYAHRQCPFGDTSDHYDSADEARQAYEKKMEVELATDNKLNASKLSKSDLNRLAKTTQSTDILQEVVTRGSTRSLSNLAKNPHASSEYLIAAAAATNDDKIRDALVAHPNFGQFPEKIIDDPILYAKAVKAQPPYSEAAKRLVTFPGVNDRVAELLDSQAYNIDFLRTPSISLSQDKIVELSESRGMYMDAALGSGNYPLAQRAATMDSSLLEGAWSGITASPDADGINALARRALSDANPRLASDVLRNSLVSNGNLKLIATCVAEGQLGDDSDTLLMQVYRHPNASDSLKEKVARQSSRVGSLAKLEDLDRSLNGQLAQTIGSGQEQRVGGSTQGRIVQFNPTEVKRLGLTPQDIDVYVRDVKGNYLFSSQYNPDTGIYRGYID